MRKSLEFVLSEGQSSYKLPYQISNPLYILRKITDKHYLVLNQKPLNEIKDDDCIRFFKLSGYNLTFINKCEKETTFKIIYETDKTFNFHINQR